MYYADYTGEFVYKKLVYKKIQTKISSKLKNISRTRKSRKLFFDLKKR